MAAVVSPCLRSNIELVIACNAPRRSIDPLRRRYPAVRFSAIDSSVTLPELRAAGMREATGEIIVLLDDAATMQGATRAASLLVAAIEQGGTVQATDARAVQWGPLLGRLIGRNSMASEQAPEASADGAPRGMPAASHAAGD